MVRPKKAVFCAECNKSFQQPRYLRNHVNRIHSEEAKMKKAAASSSLSNFSCSMCGKKFRFMSHLQRHQMAHLNAREHQCPLCAIAFNQREHLKRHLATVHSQIIVGATQTSSTSTKCNAKSFVCNRCPFGNDDGLPTRAFPSNWELNRHNAKVHPSQLKCSQCENDDVMFGTFDALKAHTEYHSGKRRFMCTVCYYAFKQKSELDNHTAAKHSHKGRFECVKCSALFTQRTQAERHALSGQCDSGNATATLRCRDCLQSFGRRRSFYRHMWKRHKYRDLFLCKFCLHYFTDAPKQRAHVQQQHFRRLDAAKRLKKQSMCTISKQPVTSHSNHSEQANPNSLHEYQLRLVVRYRFDANAADANALASLDLEKRLPSELLRCFPSLHGLRLEPRPPPRSDNQSTVFWEETVLLALPLKSECPLSDLCHSLLSKPIQIDFTQNQVSCDSEACTALK